ncbi:unnamed protein product [Closterium sp. Naga37s-1]|nr:unnamed protein product [Closterium sp. Naga37s-1]
MNASRFSSLVLAHPAILSSLPSFPFPALPKPTFNLTPISVRFLPFSSPLSPLLPCYFSSPLPPPPSPLPPPSSPPTALASQPSSHSTRISTIFSHYSHLNHLLTALASQPSSHSTRISTIFSQHSHLNHLLTALPSQPSSLHCFPFPFHQCPSSFCRPLPCRLPSSSLVASHRPPSSPPIVLPHRLPSSSLVASHRPPSSPPIVLPRRLPSSSLVASHRPPSSPPIVLPRRLPSSSLVASHLPLCPSHPCPPTAGHSTTAHLLTWTFYLLAKHPDWQERLRAELKQALTQQGAQATSAVPTASTAAGAADEAGSEADGGKHEERSHGESGGEGAGGGQEGGERGEGERGGGGRGGVAGQGGGGRVTWEVVAVLRDIGMVLQESLRMFPPVPFLGRGFRLAPGLGPYDVRRGVNVLIPVALLHYDPRY